MMVHLICFEIGTDGTGASRPRPRASNKKNRSRQNDLEVVDATSISDDITEEVAMHEVTEDAFQDEELTGPFPGGPADLSVLSCFGTHVAASIWQGEVLFDIFFCIMNHVCFCFIEKI